MYRKLFLSLALFVLTLTACEFQEPVASIPVPQAAEESGGCRQIMEYRTFDLHPSLANPGTYKINVETGPFSIDNCMCRLVSYTFYVSKESNLQWELSIASNHVVLPFSHTTNILEDILTIYDLEPIFQAYGNPGNGDLLAWIAKTSPIPNPELNRATGLCIIDNYDGDGVLFDIFGNPVTSQANGPVIQMVNGPVPGNFIVKVFIPIGITDPI